VASRCPQRFFLAASISRSTSACVRCSRVRLSAFGGRLGVTVRFTMTGVTSFRCDFGMCLALAVPTTVRTMPLIRTVSWQTCCALVRRVDSARSRAVWACFASTPLASSSRGVPSVLNGALPAAELGISQASPAFKRSDKPSAPAYDANGRCERLAHRSQFRPLAESDGQDPEPT
jgi:hypothetical protein